MTMISPALMLLAQAAEPCKQAAAEGSLSDVAKLLFGAPVTFVTAAIGFYVSQIILYSRTRSTLLVALKEEATTAKNAVAHMLTCVRVTLPEAEAIAKESAQGPISFETLNKLYSGWIIYVPTYSLIDTTSKMKRWSATETEKQIRTIIRYFDRWSTVSLYEKSYSAAHAKLVELTAKAHDPNERTRIREAASQVHECLSMLVEKSQELLNAAREVEELKV